MKHENRVKVQIWMDEQLVTVLDEISKELDTNRSELVRRLLLDFAHSWEGVWPFAPRKRRPQ